jgi:CheY-like chemotaxis protein
MPDRRARTNDRARQGRYTVLYIEDNAVNVRLVERLFERRTDIRLLSAPTGREGLAMAETHEPSIVLLDLHLPDMDGTEVLARLRADPATQSVPVVIVSADSRADQIDQLLGAGAELYMTKPVDIHELVDTVDAIIHRTAG